MQSLHTLAHGIAADPRLLAMAVFAAVAIIGCLFNVNVWFAGYRAGREEARREERTRIEIAGNYRN